MALTETEIFAVEFNVSLLVFPELDTSFRWPFGQLKYGIAIALVEIDKVLTGLQLAVFEIEPGCVLDVVCYDSIASGECPVSFTALKSPARSDCLYFELLWLCFGFGLCWSLGMGPRNQAHCCRSEPVCRSGYCARAGR